MNASISVTFAQIVSACAAIITVSGAVAVIAGILNKAKEPNIIQDERITEIEKRLAAHDVLFSKDQKRIEALENGTRVTQRAILALLSHGIDGNNTEEMKKAKHELEEYLIGRN